MPQVDGSAIILTLMSFAVSLLGFIFVNEKNRNERIHRDHEDRIRRVEMEMSEIMLIKRDIEYIRQTLEEMKRGL